VRNQKEKSELLTCGVISRKCPFGVIIRIRTLARIKMQKKSIMSILTIWVRVELKTPEIFLIDKLKSLIFYF
jgi:hypothetical protein